MSVVEPYQLGQQIKAAILQGKAEEVKNLLLSDADIRTLRAIGFDKVSVKTLAHKLNLPIINTNRRLIKYTDAGYINQKRVISTSKRGPIFEYSLKPETIEALEL